MYGVRSNAEVHRYTEHMLAAQHCAHAQSPGAVTAPSLAAYGSTQHAGILNDNF